MVDRDDTFDRITQQTTTVSLPEYDLAPGMKLGEYQLAQKLGQGGMGVVYEAVHPLIGKRAAIKILKKELCDDPGSLERFVDEARVVNQIGHPNIVDVFAFGEMPDGRSYFVMELLKGETLRSRIAKGRLSLDEVRNIIKPLARALQAAHDKGVIHRDLKPDNVFLVDVPDGEPTAKLLDFGIAKLAKNDHRVEKTATGAIVGTPQYIAPEQAKGYAIDPRADIYALGAILFELLTGRPPFIADNAMEMVAKHLMEAPIRPSAIQRGILPELDDLVLRMLAKSPDARPSLGELIAVIERSRASGATVPFDRLTPPPAKSVPAEPVASVGEVIDTARDRSVQTSLPAIPSRTRPRWVVPAILTVPVVAVLAFVIVSNLGASEPATPSPAPARPIIEPIETDDVAAPDDKIVGTPAPTSDASVVTEPVTTTPEPATTTPEPTTTTPESVTTKTDPATTRPEVRPEVRVEPPGKTAKKDPAKKDPAKKDPARKDLGNKADPLGELTIPDGDGLALPKK